MADYTPEQFIKHLEEKLAKKRNSVVDVLTAEFVDVVCQEMPVEDGHAHQAWITAADQAADMLWQSGRIERAAEKHRTKASGDPEAEKHARGTAKKTKTMLVVRIENKLPFVKKLELGLPITVGDKRGNRGPKEGGLDTMHDLYAPRIPYTGGSRQGWLMWNEGGKAKFAKVRTPPAHGFFAKAIAAVRAKAKQVFKET